MEELETGSSRRRRYFVPTLKQTHSQLGYPSARVVRLPNVDHYVFRSNEADVIREMNAFLTKLP